MTLLNIKADLPVGGGTDRPADGFSFNLARPGDPVLDDGQGFAGWGTETDLPEEGTTTGLGIGFDEWDSGGGDVVGMSVRIDNTLVQQIALPTLNGTLEDITSLQTGPRGPAGAGDISVLGWAPFEIDLQADKTLKISWKNNVVFNGPIAIEPLAGQLVFGGRTGGVTRHTTSTTSRSRFRSRVLWLWLQPVLALCYCDCVVAVGTEVVVTEPEGNRGERIDGVSRRFPTLPVFVDRWLG